MPLLGPHFAAVSLEPLQGPTLGRSFPLLEDMLASLARFAAGLCLLASTAQADTLQAAVEFLDNAGIPVPPGYTVQYGPTTGDAPGEVNPDAGTINVNPDGVQAFTPGVSGDPTEWGGILVIVLLHEYEHCGQNYTGNGYACHEIQIQFDTASSHDWLICHILDLIPNADVSPLCSFYEFTRNSFNNGVNTPGGASTVFSNLGCPGSYPGDIPESECCP